ncbi:MAG: sulfite exporter TauE/SafE family protein [Candidatus Obscuribacterales bacterium]|nr:sulfite exporter TauE/SafE family protein [Candidatus Obscuribacterales bacterium]
MDSQIIIAAFAALGASLLTFFTGFGLGTILLPVLAVFLPLANAVAATALVHFFNSTVKLCLTFRHTNRLIVLKFGIPAFIASYCGAKLLVLTQAPKLPMALLMAIFAIVDLLKLAEKIKLPNKNQTLWLAAGGTLSGLFGGYSGHQGAFRTAFLLRMGLSKEALVATAAALAFLVDLMRLMVYQSSLNLYVLAGQGENLMLPITFAATASALLGTIIGSRLLKKVEIRQIEILASVMLLAVSLALAFGYI